MEEILKHLKGDEQYRFLQNLLRGAVKQEDLPKRIQEIMDSINKK